MELVFWASFIGVAYPYVIYPIILMVVGRLVRRREPEPYAELPSVSVIIPVHNEARRIERKITNTAALIYPAERLQVIYVSDGSTDDTVPLIAAQAPPETDVIELPERRGKASALNAGLARAAHDIIVFTDASIMLEADALVRIVRHFRDPEVGCVSGEDRIGEAGGEAWYGAYELMLRRLESQVHSIVGASGSFYAQRRSICGRFVEGHAPDFLSVLRTVELGYCAVSDPQAAGAMTTVKDPRLEFERKVRTLLRGMTTLFAHPAALNPFRTGLFAFEVFSHKMMRWIAPLFLVLALLSSIALFDSMLYRVAFFVQALFYLGALAAFSEWGSVHRSLPGKIALYFSSVNAAVLAAWYQYGRGVRQEIWTPTRR